MLDDETLQMYVDESREHLADIEADLLTMEQNGANIDEELVNKVFRAAHSVKGGAGFMGLTNIKELAHKMENILGMMRSREMVPNPENINILLLGADMLKSLVEDATNSNEVDISSQVEALVRLTAASLPVGEKEQLSNITNIPLPDGRGTLAVSDFDMTRARKKGKFIYFVDCDLIHDFHERGSTPLELLKKLERGGDILEAKVDIMAIGTLDGDNVTNKIPFLIIYATILEPEMVNGLFGINDKNIYLIEADLTLRNLAAPAAKPMAEPAVVRPETAPFNETKAESPTLSQPCQSTAESDTIKAEQLPADHDNQPATSTAKKQPPSKSTESDSTIRVSLRLLDSLMNLAGELVLGRNQLLQAMMQQDIRNIRTAGQRLDLITSELQEAIMLTRMQPIGNIFNRYVRVIRDMAATLHKQIELVVEGEDVELDKTIIEGLADPMTHLVRNAADHGLESTKERIKAGKPPTGKVILRAYHEAGQVNIEVCDDGKGIDGPKIAEAAVAKGLISEEQSKFMSLREKVALIFLPGFSTAAVVSDVSGRGVGMDVVKTNLDQLGGNVEIESKPGVGTTIRIKLPLTLAIIPSQIISVGQERYAIPQINMDELLRIPANEVKNKIEKVGDAEVVRLREHLLPIVRLSDILGLDRTYVTPPPDLVENPDRRDSVADRRSKHSPLVPYDAATNEPDEPNGLDSKESTYPLAGEGFIKKRQSSDRRYHATSAVHIVVVSTGALRYGLVVDRLHDPEEIVVKPLGRHFKRCKGYAGATTMGDGRVALILDVTGLAQMAGLTSLEGSKRAAEVANEAASKNRGVERQAMLSFRSAEDEQFVAPLALVQRIEKIEWPDVETIGDSKVIKYRGSSLPVFSIDQVAKVGPISQTEELLVVVFSVSGKEVGILATPPIDALEYSTDFDASVLRQPGIMGSAIIEGRTTLMIDIYDVVARLRPDWVQKVAAVPQIAATEKGKILFAEDSNFFRTQVKGYMEDRGYNVIEAADGAIAWKLLEKLGDEIGMVVTDLEMPNMDGFALTKKIRGDSRFSSLPVVALTTLADDQHVAKGREAGINEYLIKLDKDTLVDALIDYMK